MTSIEYAPFLLSLLIDLVSVGLLSYVFYFRRHKNRDMFVAVSIINVTLFALAGALASFTLSLGVGFALFAVISIIRLRSDEAGWVEMAYLLVSLSVGLILGLPGYSLFEKCIYATVLVVAMFLIDHPTLLIKRRIRKVSLTLDGTSLDEVALKATVEALVGRTVDEVTVKGLTLVPPTTKVDVRYTEKVS